MRWPFRRRPRVRPPINEDWRTGDTAECIGGDWRAGPPRRPGRGDRAIVLSVRPGHADGRELGWALELLGYAGLWDARGFRKVIPPRLREERKAGRRSPADLENQPT